MEFEVDIDDEVYARVKQVAEREGITAEELIVRYLTQYVEGQARKPAPEPPDHATE